MLETIQHHQNQNIEIVNISLCTCYSRTLIRAALTWSNTTVETISSDLILCGCTKKYLRHTGKQIERLEQWEFDLIGTFYQQVTNHVPPVVKLRLDEIGQIIRSYTDLNRHISNPKN
jgi:hypothetical protein